MWRVAFVFVVLFTCGAFAKCVSVDTVTKCARLPEDLWDVVDGGAYGHHYSGDVFSYVYQDVLISGIASGMTYCTVTNPFSGAYEISPGPDGTKIPAKNCAYFLGDIFEPVVPPTSLNNDACPDGFYTVPYNVSCGEGLVDVSDVPQCDSDTSGDYCLIGEVKTPCAAGITTLRTGTGVIVPLWAERGTEPSLCVKYNDTVCYGNLEPGQAANMINVNYNGAIYHTVD